jgi:hypothetical protein
VTTALVLSTPVTPSPRHPRGAEQTPHGPAFLVTLLILGALLWLSFWRLRRRTSPPEN